MIKTKTKFFLFWFLILFFAWSVSFWFDYKVDCIPTRLILTAYYSPIKNQTFYFKENFVADKILNGEWLTWASWKWVFNWMLAAPKKYAFGTKIIFPTLGIWEVADRGWAIVESWNLWHDSDRIDVWMWWWEEWLIKALTFGKQTMTGYICSWVDVKNIKTSIDFKKIPIYKWFFDSAIWLQKLEPGRRDVWVWKLQQYLIKLWYLTKNQDTWNYGPETKKALCKYQTKKWLSSSKHFDCWYFGTNTRYTMKQEVKEKKLLPSDMFDIVDLNVIKKISQERDVAKKIVKVAQNLSFENYFDKPFTKNVYDEKVIKLQELLKRLWYYSGENNWIYSSTTSNAVYVFQQSQWLLQWYENDPSVNGYIWPATRLALNKKLIESQEQQKVEILTEIIWPKTQISKAKKSFQFYRAYTKNEWPNQEIRILQKFLINQKLYSWSFDWVYSKKTMDWVQKFQVKYWLIWTWADVTVQGFMGPKTRNKVNELID